MLRVENLTKRYNRQTVIDDVSLLVDGGIRVIIGLNGSGKSTLLKCIAGTVEIDSGRIMIGDRDITGLQPEARRVGYVPQQPAMFNHLNVRENIRYSARNGRGSQELMDRFVDMLDLRGVLERRPSELSGGFKSRVALARALASAPDVMLLDEPLGDIDVAIKGRILPEFKAALKVLGVPVLYVTHDPWEADMIGEAFSVMVTGKIIDTDSAASAFESIKELYVRPQ